ncbi:ammonium transporter [Acinetobacter qingfengensis]|uniref:Ammonium transporter n=1 Tax=Acinetobacter qingfengensis TaxID=1262585 RepID=A0A1E7R543_9GAMM|nr:ammonium transporter [Acinetobacter qingfengensis]KAA8732449.1 ammonium transporter [Acinetobacter qingfengensis]OEY94444.1 ammonia channel protein [Acinetobacter qingfengensis]
MSLIVKYGLFLFLMPSFLLTSHAYATTYELDKGNTTWVMVAGMFVTLMCIPGLAMFYGGFIRSKNVLSIFAQMFISAGVIGVLWVIYGYSLAVNTTGMVEGEYNLHSFIGTLDNVFLNGINLANVNELAIPDGILIFFLMTFAIITPAIIIGGFAERMKFSASLLFLIIWFTLCFLPMFHMVWGGPGALMHNWGTLDFAGGTAVHMNAGLAALIASIMVGKRKGYLKVAMPPHNVTLALTGAGILWVCWFGFNVGSGLAVNENVGTIMLCTQIAACSGILGWVMVEMIYRKKPSALGAASGALAGLVGITPACAFVGPIGAICIGFVTAICCYYAVTTIKHRFEYDDSVDVFGLHGIGGIVGALLTGIFASPLLGGNVADLNIIQQLWIQLISVVFTIVYCGGMSWMILKILDKTIGLRASENDEEIGLDIAHYNENAYNK